MADLAKRILRIQPSPTLSLSARVKALQQEGRDIIDLTVGEPDFDTPDFIKEAAVSALREGLTKYTPVDGLPALKEAVREKFQRENHLAFSRDQIIASVGAKQALFNLAQVLLNPGDEAIIPSPYWTSYPDIVMLAEGIPRVVTAPLEQGFRITPEQLEAAINPTTRLFILNSPANPTGAAYSEEELRGLGEVLARHPRVVIASDDIYEHIFWGGRFCNILNACPELGERTVIINGVSKAYAMTGWRIGYAAGPRDIIQAMKTLQSQSTSNPTSIAQAAAAAALTGDQSPVRAMAEAFERRHALFVEGLNALPGLRCLPSQGTFYAFPEVNGALGRLGLKDDIALAERLIEAGVAAVPGSAFGAPGFLRFSFAASEKRLEEALARLSKALA